MGKRFFIVDHLCIPEERLYDALSLTINASLMLSRSVRRDTCVYVVLEYRGVNYVLEACGDRIKYFRPDIGSSSGFIKRVLRNGCFGGVCLRRDTAITPRDSCFEAKALIEEMVDKSNISSLCSVLAYKNLCLEFKCVEKEEDLWWLIAVSNILLDLLNEHCPK